MNRQEIIKALDEEINRLHQVKALLVGSQSITPAVAKLVSNRKGSPRSSSRRTISAEGRRRIAEAQKRRWAKQKHR